MKYVQFSVTEEGYSKLQSAETKAFPADNLVVEENSSTHTELHYYTDGKKSRYLVVGNFASTLATVNSALADDTAKSPDQVLLVAGTVTIIDAKVTADSHISVQRTLGDTVATLGELIVTRSAGVSFTVTSTLADNSGTEIGDSSGFTWFIKY